MPAYAIAITEDNIRGVIASEAGPNFDFITALQWLKEYEEGWFVRDEETAFDCKFFEPTIFLQIYAFTSNDDNDLIRNIIRI